MKKIKFYFLFLISISCALTNSFAQKQGQELTDSLVTELSRADEDTNKVNLYSEVSFYLSFNKPEEAIKYGISGLELAEKLNFGNGVAALNRNIGLAYNTQSFFPKALEFYFMSLKKYEELQNKAGISKVMLSIGQLYSNQMDFENALKYFQNALKGFEESGSKSAVSKTLNNIGIVYSRKKDFSKAIEYYKKSLKIKEEIGDKNGIESNISNLANCYYQSSDYDKALEFYNNALKINTETGNTNYRAVHLGSIGNIYLAIVNDSSGILMRKYFDGNKIKALNTAKLYFDSSIILFTRIGNVNDMHPYYKSLSEVHELMGNSREALFEYKKYVAGKDSVFNQENTRKTMQLQMHFEIEKKEQEIALLTSQQEVDRLSARQRLGIIFGMGGALLGMISVAGSFYYQYKKTQKTNANLELAYKQLSEAQGQLIKSEKMAAFGVMASRVSHEILNPLNFVNNFSELSQDMVTDIITSKTETEKRENSELLLTNLKKINEHGIRAVKIVKQLQEHSAKGTAQEFFESN